MMLIQQDNQFKLMMKLELVDFNNQKGKAFRVQYNNKVEHKVITVVHFINN